jgi:hypothetical protein
VCVEPPRPHQPTKAEIGARTSVSWHAQTSKNLLYIDLDLDLDSHGVKSALRAHKDEAQTTLPILHRTLAW